MVCKKTPICSIDRCRRSNGASRLLGLRRVALVALLGILSGGSGCVLVHEHQARVHVSRGETHLEAQDLSAALKEFQAAAQIAPQMAVAHSRIGVVYRQMGEYEHAAESFIEAIRHNPFSFDDAFELAQVYHFMHRIRDAVQAYLHAAQLRDDDFDVQLNLGVCYQEAGELQQAVERFNQAIAIDPDRSHGYVNLGVALDAQEKYYEAIRAYKESLERDSTQPVVLVNLARTYLNQGRLKMARNALRQATRMDPELAVAHEALGYCLFRMREFTAAKASYQQALAYDSRLARAHVGLGSISMLQYLEGDTQVNIRERALNHWHRSLELNPDQPRIRKLIARYTPNRTDPAEIFLGEQGLP